MKRSLIYIFLTMFLFGAVVYFFTPLGPKVRGYVGRSLNKNAVAIKVDKQLSETAYDWTLMDTAGNSYSFEREKKKVVFLNFWATWCAPCLREMPDIQKLYDDYGNQVDFLLVTQENLTTVNGFLSKKDYTLPMYISAAADIPEELASKSTPTTYIIAKSGKIVRAETGAADWNSDTIRSLLETLLAE